MGLFNDLSEMLADGQQMTVTLRKQGFELVASIMPNVSGVKDKAVENISPICLSGSPEDFETGFIEALKQGLPKAAGLVNNIREYEESVENARKATEMAKKAKDEKEKLKKEFDGWISLARQNLSENKFRDAKYCVTKAAEIKDANKAVIDKIKADISSKSGEGSIFGGAEDKSDGKNIKPGKDFKVQEKTESDVPEFVDNELEEEE